MTTDLLLDDLRKELARGRPTVAIRRSNLGSVLQALGDLEGAKTQLERALATTGATYGPDHPTVATVAANLASLNDD